MDLVATEIVPTFEIVESPVANDPLWQVRHEQAHAAVAREHQWTTALNSVLAHTLRDMSPNSQSLLFPLLDDMPLIDVYAALLHDAAEDEL